MEPDGVIAVLSSALAVALAGAGGVLLGVGAVPVRSWLMTVLAMATLLGGVLLVLSGLGSPPWIGVVFALLVVVANAVTSALRWRRLPQLSGARLPELFRLVLLRPDILRRMAADAVQLEGDRRRRQGGRGTDPDARRQRGPRR